MQQGGVQGQSAGCGLNAACQSRLLLEPTGCPAASILAAFGLQALQTFHQASALACLGQSKTLCAFEPPVITEDLLWLRMVMESSCQAVALHHIHGGKMSQEVYCRACL